MVIWACYQFNGPIYLPSTILQLTDFFSTPEYLFNEGFHRPNITVTVVFSIKYAATQNTMLCSDFSEIRDLLKIFDSSLRISLAKELSKDDSYIRILNF